MCDPKADTQPLIIVPPPEDTDKQQAPQPPTRLGPKAQPEQPPVTAADHLKAKDAERKQRQLTDALKAGMIDALKKASSQIAHSTDLNFTGIRSTSVQRHPDGQDLVVVVDVVPNVFHDGPLSR